MVCRYSRTFLLEKQVCCTVSSVALEFVFFTKQIALLFNFTLYFSHCLLKLLDYFFLRSHAYYVTGRKCSRCTDSLLCFASATTKRMLSWLLLDYHYLYLRPLTEALYENIFSRCFSKPNENVPESSDVKGPVLSNSCSKLRQLDFGQCSCSYRQFPSNNF